jgi:hypothetical protein
MASLERVPFSVMNISVLLLAAAPNQVELLYLWERATIEGKAIIVVLVLSLIHI